MIQFHHLFKKYGNRVALHDVHVELNPSGVTGILGPNGSGKTTLAKVLMGLVFPTEGDVTIGGNSIKSGASYRNNMGYLPQLARFPENLLLHEVLSLTEAIRGKAPRKLELLDYFKLEEFLFTRVAHLSGGNRQKLNLVNALMFNSPVLVLDEPTTGLDPLSVLQFKQLLKTEAESGKTIVLTTHVLELAEATMNYIMFLVEGKVQFCGSMEDMLAANQAPSLELAMIKILGNG